MKQFLHMLVNIYQLHIYKLFQHPGSFRFQQCIEFILRLICKCIIILMLLNKLTSLHETNYYISYYINTISDTELEDPNSLSSHILHITWSFNVWYFSLSFRYNMPEHCFLIWYIWILMWAIPTYISAITLPAKARFAESLAPARWLNTCLSLILCNVSF